MAIVDITKPMALDETLQGTNTKMDAVIQKLQGIIDALGLDTSVYKPKGNITCAALVPALLIDDNLGNVYNVTDNGTTTSDFVEGAGKPIHVGDNVAIVDIGTGGQSEYKFDLLAGMVDLTNYVQKSQTAGLLKNDGTVDTKDYAEKVSGATNGNLAGLNATGNPTDSGISGDMTTTSATGNPISIADLKSAQIALNPVITFEPIQAGSGTPSPSNIRAISGYDKVEVLSCGKNICQELWRQGDWDGRLDNARVSAQPDSRILLKAGVTYYFYNSGYSTYQWSAALLYHKYDTSFFSTIPWIGNETYTFTPTVDCYIAIVFAGITTIEQITPSNIPAFMVCENSIVDKTYSPYHKTTDLSESLGQTVYGGTLDVRTGELIDNMDIVNDLSLGTWYLYATNSFYSDSFTSRFSKAYNGICSAYKNCGASVSNIENYGFVGDANGRIYMKNEDYSDATAFKNSLVNVQFCAPKKTSTTIQLTPHEIALSQGYNYISTNGTSISLAYHNGELASLGDVAQVGETVNELGDEIAYIKAHRTLINKYNQRHSFISSTDFAYTGLSITIPDHCMFTIFAYANYNNAQPYGLIISTSSTSINAWEILYNGGLYGTVSGQTDWTARTYYIWAKYSDANQNEIIYGGWYEPLLS